MKEYQLFFSAAVLEYLAGIPKRDSRLLLKAIYSLPAAPESKSSELTSDNVGRLLYIHRVGKYAIEYWVDAADQQIKVMCVR